MRDGVVAANVVVSQTALHARFGGVVPEQASREHLGVLDDVVGRALRRADAGLDALDAVAVTFGPGLVGALLVGLSYAKALAWGRGVPLLPVHHLEAHIAGAVAGTEVHPPFLCLIASGGHTALFAVHDWQRVRPLGHSRDDAAGEAFDKVARLLGLGYPGGPALAALAERGDDSAVALPRPLRGQPGFDFSFSGLKTAVAVMLERNPQLDPADVAASFERTVVASLSEVTLRAARATGLSTLVVAGGVAANRRLRRAFEGSGLDVAFPAPDLATDNGAMVALAGSRRLERGEGRDPEAARAAWSCDARPYLPLAESPAADASSKAAT